MEDESRKLFWMTELEWAIRWKRGVERGGRRAAIGDGKFGKEALDVVNKAEEMEMLGELESGVEEYFKGRRGVR